MIHSGGLIRYSKRADEHAERMYERARRSRDFLNVAKNTGLSIEQAQAVQNYLFKNYHYLGGDTLTKRFYPSYEIAESWRRLSERDGKHIQPHDMMLLLHELYEITLLLQHSRMSQAEAHRRASAKYPYDRASEEFYRNSGQ